MARKITRKTNSLQPEVVLEKQNFDPLTPNQSKAFYSWKKGQHLMLLGSAGTGKTFLALNFACDELEKEKHSKILIIRSIVSARDPGALPGTLKEKSRVFEAPYSPILAKLYDKKDAYDLMKSKQKIEFVTTSFLRGLTYDDCIIIIEEAQNMSAGELETVMTRVGENTRVIICGDTRQDDLTSERFKETSGLRQFAKIINKIK